MHQLQYININLYFYLGVNDELQNQSLKNCMEEVINTQLSKFRLISINKIWNANNFLHLIIQKLQFSERKSWIKRKDKKSLKRSQNLVDVKRKLSDTEKP